MMNRVIDFPEINEFTVIALNAAATQSFVSTHRANG
jgi:hypothetical protein